MSQTLTWKKVQGEKKLLEETFLVLIKSNASLIPRFFQLSPNVLLVAFWAFAHFSSMFPVIFFIY